MKALARAKVSPTVAVTGFAMEIQIVAPAPIPLTLKEDPSDDEVLACAVAAAADCIVTGDRYMLELKSFQGIAVLSASELLKRLKAD